MPRWFTRVATLGAAWIALVTASALWLPHEWDWKVFELLSSEHRPTFSPDVAIIDVAWNTADLPSNRRRIAAVLDRLRMAKSPPLAAVVDVVFDPCQTSPCGEPMESVRLRLASSIRAASRVFPVYGVVQPAIDRDDEVVGPVDARDDAIYGAYTGVGHTRFTVLPRTAGAFFRACYSSVPLAAAGNVRQNVWSIVDRVLLGAAPTTALCDTSHIPLYLGTPYPAANLARAGDDTIARLPDLGAKYVVIGTVEHDHSQFSDRSGPELVGWALSNSLDLRLPATIRTLYDTRPQNATLIALVPAFSALAVVYFIAVFSVLRRTRLRGLRPALPWISVVAAAALVLATFAGFEAWMYKSAEIQPQVTLISVGAVFAALLSGFRAHQIVADEESAIDASPGETFDYDVFVSYAHDEGAWVYENIYVKLRDARLPDGSPLSIFFDTTSISGGTAWQQKIALAVDGSRFVIPVYSDLYFSRPYCRFEARRAHRKWIGAGEESRCVLPVMRGHPVIDKTIDDIQAISIDDQPDVVDRYVAEIVARLAEARERGRLTGSRVAEGLEHLEGSRDC